jgi:hypothetical protein
VKNCGDAQARFSKSLAFFIVDSHQSVLSNQPKQNCKGRKILLTCFVIVRFAGTKEDLQAQEAGRGVTVFTEPSVSMLSEYVNSHRVPAQRVWQAARRAGWSS